LIILIKLAGFLFLFILVLYVVIQPVLGYKVEISDFEAELQRINENRKKFQLTLVLALIHNVSVITLTITLFLVFGPPYNIILGIVLLICRIGEGLILISNDKNYGSFLKIAGKYSSSDSAEKSSLIDLARTTTKAIGSRFKFAMILWTIGNLAFSIVLITYGVAPIFIGWLGIVASILIGLDNVIGLKKPNLKTKTSFRVLLIVGGLSAISFEVIIGIFLLFF